MRWASPASGATQLHADPNLNLDGCSLGRLESCPGSMSKIIDV